MKLRHDKLKNLAAGAGLSLEQLAQAVARPGLEGDAALSAVSNWLSGRDHPRCKAADIARLAAAVRVQPKDIAKFTSQVRYHRGSARKARLVVDMIRGKDALQAVNVLQFSTKRAAVDILKALKAACADAELLGADATSLEVCESRIDEGPRMKRFQPKDRGRAHPIIKPMSHVTISVQERA